jgi:hypothetical protein
MAANEICLYVSDRPLSRNIPAKILKKACFRSTSKRSIGRVSIKERPMKRAMITLGVVLVGLWSWLAMPASAPPKAWFPRPRLMPMPI